MPDYDAAKWARLSSVTVNRHKFGPQFVDEYQVNANDNTWTVLIDGKWLGRASFQATIDGLQWFGVYLQNVESGCVASNTHCSGLWRGQCTGFRKVRVVLQNVGPNMPDGGDWGIDNINVYQTTSTGIFTHAVVDSTQEVGISTSVPTPTPIASQDYRLVADYDFNGINVWDANKLKQYFYAQYLSGGGKEAFLNDEQARYQDFNATNHVHDRAAGTLNLTSGLMNSAGANLVTSGMLRTRIGFRFGYFELTCQMPKGGGAFPAFWFIAENGIWPPEVDIFEMLDQSGKPNVVDRIYNTNMVLQTIHNGTAPATITRMSTNTSWKGGMLVHDAGVDLSAGMHKYACEWTPDTITFFVDDEVTRAIDTKLAGNSPYCHLLVNLSLGGAWAGPITATLPIALKIKSLRVWQRASYPAYYLIRR